MNVEDLVVRVEKKRRRTKQTRNALGDERVCGFDTRCLLTKLCTASRV
jgi:hypothetical protein